VTDFAESRK